MVQQLTCSTLCAMHVDDGMPGDLHGLEATQGRTEEEREK
jgi:hypothetical protein